MKKSLFAVLCFAGIVGVILAVPAFSSSSAPSHKAGIPRQIKQLNAKVRALQSRVTQLEKAVGGIKSCTSTVQALSRFNGYVWYDGVGYYTTTAVDVPDTGEPIGAYFVLADPSCVGSNALSHYSLAAPQGALTRSQAGDRLDGLMQMRAGAPSQRAVARMSPQRLSR
jgi:hypothetical protein